MSAMDRRDINALKVRVESLEQTIALMQVQLNQLTEQKQKKPATR